MVLVQWALAVAMAMFLVPWVGMWFGDILRAVVEDGLPAYPLPLGIGLGVGFAFARWRRPNWFVHTFVHETAHALVCVLTGVKVRKFMVTDGDGGYVLPERTDPIRRYFILIAPYVLPVLLAPVLVALWFIDGPVELMCVPQFLAGMGLIHHLHGLYHNIRINWSGSGSDLVRLSRPLSVVSILIGFMLMMGWWLQTVWY